MYSYSGTHWNSYGSYFAYCRLIEEIKKWYPEEKPMPLSHFKKVVRVNSDSLMHALGLTKFIPEPSKITHLLLSSPSSRVVKNVRKENKGETRISDKGNIRALVFGDSFFDKLSPLMAEHFSYVYRPNKSIPEMNLMKKLISDEKPDIFIEQRVERYLNTYP